MQLSTGRTTLGWWSGALFWSRGLKDARLVVSWIQGVSPCSTTRPLPHLASHHPYSRSSAPSRFFHGSLHVHTLHHHHHVLCRGVSSVVTTKVFLDCLRIQVRVSSLYGGASHPSPIIRCMITHPPPRSPPIPMEDTHTHTQVTSIDLLVQMAGNTTASGRLLSFDLLTVH